MTADEARESLKAMTHYALIPRSGQSSVVVHHSLLPSPLKSPACFAFSSPSPQLYLALVSLLGQYIPLQKSSPSPLYPHLSYNQTLNSSTSYYSLNHL